MVLAPELNHLDQKGLC